MGRRSERLCRQGDVAGDGDVIQVVSRAFDVLRCFEGHDVRLGNLEISNRCGLPRSTVSRLTHTLTRMGQLVYLPRDQKYRIGPSAVAMSTSMTRGLQLRNLIRSRLQGSRRPDSRHHRLPDPRSLPSGLSRIRPRGARARFAFDHRQPHLDQPHRGRSRLRCLARRQRRGRAGGGDSARSAGRCGIAERADRGRSRDAARARLRGVVRSVQPAHQRHRRADLVAAVPDLCDGDDRCAGRDVRRAAAA